MRLKRVRHTGCILGPGIFKDVEVDGLQGRMLMANGCAFVRCVLKGRVDRLLYNSEYRAYDADPVYKAAIESENQTLHSEAEWCLDISEVEAVDLAFRGLPNDKLRLDPETQVVVKRGAIEALSASQVEQFSAFGQVHVAMMRQRGDDDFLCIACRRSKKFKEQLEQVRQFYDLGIVSGQT